MRKVFFGKFIAQIQMIFGDIQFLDDLLSFANFQGCKKFLNKTSLSELDKQFTKSFDDFGSITAKINQNVQRQIPNCGFDMDKDNLLELVQDFHKAVHK